MQNSNQKYNSQKYQSEYKDYSTYAAIMISTDQLIFNERSSVQARMIRYSKLYKELHIIIFSTRKDLENNSRKISENCSIYSTNSHTRWNYISNARKVGKKIIKKIDQKTPLLVTCQDPFETALVGKCLANLRKNSELLLQIHVDLFSPFFPQGSFLNRIRLIVSKFTLPHADVIRVVSNKIADSLVIRGFRQEDIIVKPIEISVDNIKNSQPSFDLKKKYSQFSKIVLMACRLEKEKNISMALEAWKKVLEKNKTLGLIIVGSGREQGKLKKLSYKLKIDKNVIFEGWQTDLVPYLKGSDLLLVTSLYEGYGMIFKEAESAELEIVSTDVGIAREVGAKIVEWEAGKIAEGIIQTI